MASELAIIVPPSSPVSEAIRPLAKAASISSALVARANASG